MIRAVLSNGNDYVEEGLDVKSPSAARVHFTHGLPFAAQGYGIQRRSGEDGRRVGCWLLREVNGRGKLLTKATKMKEKLRGEFR
jgi:hypothetical protein